MEKKKNNRLLKLSVYALLLTIVGLSCFFAFLYSYHCLMSSIVDFTMYLANLNKDILKNAAMKNMKRIPTIAMAPQLPKNFKKKGYNMLPSHPPSWNFKFKVFFISENKTDENVIETTAKTKSILVLKIVEVMK